ncbi:hypothetical protein ABVF61_31375 [Roseibium sp. HPY-6]|uniref:hypothetical protein n=1 Tax=Roseibium sp. HPY-6 TaxID=3229852 RepID=UPI00338EAE0C
MTQMRQLTLRSVTIFSLVQCFILAGETSAYACNGFPSGFWSEEAPCLSVDDVLTSHDRVPFGTKTTALSRKILRPLWDYAEEHYQDAQVFGPFAVDADLSEAEITAQFSAVFDDDWARVTPLPVEISGWKHRMHLGSIVLFENGCYFFGYAHLKPDQVGDNLVGAPVYIVTNTEFQSPQVVD